jgi:hypothetical protein
MLAIRTSSIAAALVLISAAAFAQAQSAAPSQNAVRAPGVTRAVEHLDNPGPDKSGPDPTVDQTKPDARQPETATDKEVGAPETARDDPKLKPETAKDDQKLKPETASDVPTRLSSSAKAAEVAKKGVRSNTPPPHAPQG